MMAGRAMPVISWNGKSRSTDAIGLIFKLATEA